MKASEHVFVKCSQIDHLCNLKRISLICVINVVISFFFIFFLLEWLEARCGNELLYG